MKRRFQVYLLAGGNGSRAGGPKAWREFEGRSLLKRQVDFLTNRFEPRAIAISIQKDWRERCLRIQPDICWVSEDPKNPPMGAIQALVGELPLQDWSFLYHVDMPVWEPALFDALSERIHAAEKSGIEAIAPSHHGRKGHPLVLSPKLGPAITVLDPSKDRMDFWLRTRREDVVEVPFACIHENWNQPVA